MSSPLDAFSPALSRLVEDLSELTGELDTQLRAEHATLLVEEGVLLRRIEKLQGYMEAGLAGDDDAAVLSADLARLHGVRLDLQGTRDAVASLSIEAAGLELPRAYLEEGFSWVQDDPAENN